MCHMLMSAHTVQVKNQVAIHNILNGVHVVLHFITYFVPEKQLLSEC